MSKQGNALAKGFFLFVLLLLTGIALTVYTQSRTLMPAKAAVVSESPTPPPTPTFSTPVTRISEAHSTHADKKLILRATPATTGGTKYVFSVADISGGNERIIFMKILAPGASMFIPWNAWDPTDTYVFIKQQSRNITDYYVLNANGQPYANGDTYIDVGAVWADKQIGYTIREATGWASGTLLIIYTSKDDGSHGPAFWFEIPDTAIIQLAG